MRSPLPVCLLLALSVAACAVQPIVHTPPPADRAETVGAAPSPEHFWVRGHWKHDGRDYGWTPGHWEARVHDAVWSSGHWRPVAGGFVWVEGRWNQR